MALSFDSTLRSTRQDQITSAVGASGRLKIYDATGGTPANVGTALTTQVLLVDLPLSATMAAAAAAGVLTFNAITTTNAAATGTAAFFRVTTSAGVAKAQGTVGTSGSDLNLNTTAIVSGGPVAISSAAWTDGNP
jgi:hypothetical protein